MKVEFVNRFNPRWAFVKPMCINSEEIINLKDREDFEYTIKMYANSIGDTVSIKDEKLLSYLYILCKSWSAVFPSSEILVGCNIKDNHPACEICICIHGSDKNIVRYEPLLKVTDRICNDTGCEIGRTYSIGLPHIVI